VDIDINILKEHGTSIFRAEDKMEVIYEKKAHSQ
jgi:hypothetical protein